MTAAHLLASVFCAGCLAFVLLVAVQAVLSRLIRCDATYLDWEDEG